MSATDQLVNLQEAVELCRAVEAIAPAFGCHVALTGGVLYKDGDRKDVDLVMYRIRQVDEVDVFGLFKALASVGVDRVTVEEPWCVKATWRGKNVDFFFPDADEGDYQPREDEADSDVEGIKF